MRDTSSRRALQCAIGPAAIPPVDSDIDWIRRFAHATDPPADALAAWVRQQPPGEAGPLIEQALAKGVSSLPHPPSELATLLAATEDTPAWVDYASANRGARAITRTGALGLIVLADISLPAGYLAARATKALIGTGRIQDPASHRLEKTAAWWIMVTTPDMLRPGLPGYTATVKTRLVHAHVRASLTTSGDWDCRAWGRPLNQLHTLGTLLLLSAAFTAGAQSLGTLFTRRERDDIHHLWRLIGWLMGLDPELLPVCETDAWHKLRLLVAAEFGPDDDSRRLADALLASHTVTGEGHGKLLARARVQVHSSIGRLALGAVNADLLGLPRHRGTEAILAAMSRVNLAAETARLCIPGATALQERFGRATRETFARRLATVTKS
jgi:hypothetical protein